MPQRKPLMACRLQPGSPNIVKRFLYVPLPVFCAPVCPLPQQRLLPIASPCHTLPQAVSMLSRRVSKVQQTATFRYSLMRSCSETLIPAPFLIEGGVKSSDDKEEHGNWITVARRRLAARRGKKPETKAAQIWALWPEIRQAITEGQRTQTICVSLREEADIHMTPDTLRSYIARCRKKEKLGFVAPTAQSATGNLISSDPMSVARRALQKSRLDIRQIHSDGDPSDQNLI